MLIEAPAYWLIERGSPAEWWVSGLPEVWTNESAMAQQFTEWGAKRYAEELQHPPFNVVGPLRATEHINCIGPDLTA